MIKIREKKSKLHVPHVLFTELTSEAGQIGPKPNRPQVKSAPVKSAPSQNY